MNRCWFAARVTEVRRKYALTVDAQEANALEHLLSACASTEKVVRSCEGGRLAAAPKAPRSVLSSGATDALRLWNDKETDGLSAAKHGATASPQCRVAIRPTCFMRDGDGVVCE